MPIAVPPRPPLRMDTFIEMLDENLKMRRLLRFAINAIDGEGMTDCDEFRQIREIANGRKVAA